MLSARILPDARQKTQAPPLPDPGRLRFSWSRYHDADVARCLCPWCHGEAEVTVHFDPEAREVCIALECTRPASCPGGPAPDRDWKAWVLYEVTEGHTHGWEVTL